MAPTFDDIVLLEMTIRGRVVVPENAQEYREQCCKMHNVSFHRRRPAMFVLCHDAKDVQVTLKFVVHHELPLSIRSGGHSACGSSMKDGSVILDVSAMNRVDYDPKTELVTLQPGANLSDLNVHLLRHGRMAPVGIAPPTGCGGLVLHGGIGWALHRYGTAVDNLTAVELVLADGSLKQVSNESTDELDKELFFGVRGACGQLAVCTEMTLRTFPGDTLTGGMWLTEDDTNYTQTRKLMKQARDTVLKQEASAESRTLTGGIYAGNFPPAPFIPSEKHHRPCTIAIVGVWGDGEMAMDLAKSFVDREIVFGRAPAPMPFGIFNQLMSGQFLNFPPMACYYKGTLVGEAPDEKLDAFMDKWAKHEPWLGASLYGFEFYGGKAGIAHAKKVNGDKDHCVSTLRNFMFGIPILSYFPPGNPEFEEGGRHMARACAKIFDDARVTSYSNYCTELGDGEEAKKNAELMITNQERLFALKKKVDPENVFVRVTLPSGPAL